MSESYRIITSAEAEKRFNVSADITYPYQDFADEQEIRLYAGGLHIAGSLEPDSDDDWVPYNVIVDGDLTVDGDLNWWDWAGGNFLLFTGVVRARNVLLSGCPDVVVRGGLTASGGIQGSYGDDGGYLTVRGHIRAQFIISTKFFNMTFARRPEALLVGDDFILSHPSRTSCPPDFSGHELDDLVLAELLGKDGSADAHKISAALRAGQPVLRPGVLP